MQDTKQTLPIGPDEPELTYFERLFAPEWVIHPQKIIRGGWGAGAGPGGAATGVPTSGPLPCGNTWGVVGKSALPSILFMSHTSDLSGDITGGGSGAKSTKAKRARAVGHGKDKETQAAERQAEQAERLPWLVEQIQAEQDTGNRLLVLAYGRGWKMGQGVKLNSPGCAARAARWLWRRRAVLSMRGQGGDAMPSDTSIEQAAADAVSAMFCAVRRWDKVTSSHWDNSRLIAYLWRMGWRAACASLKSTGFTGDNSAPVSTVPLSVQDLELERKSLQTWADGCGVPLETSDAVARRAVNSFVWRALVPMSQRRNQGAFNARKFAIQRARFIIRLNHGQSILDAARLAGYESTRAALEAMRSGKVIDTLKASAGKAWRKLPGLSALASKAEAAGKAAGQAVKRARAVAHLAKAGGTMGLASSVRGKWRNGRGAGGWVNGTGGKLVAVVRSRRVKIASPFASAWRVAVDHRATAIEAAKLAKARLARARAVQAAAFDSALTCWRKGWTR